MPSNHLILCRPLLLLPLIFLNIRVFSNESALCIRWPKYWSYSFNISPSNETPGMISFRMDWLDLLAVQGTLKSLLQHHSSIVSSLLCSALYIYNIYIILYIYTRNLHIIDLIFNSGYPSLSFLISSFIYLATQLYFNRSSHMASTYI